jgi:hypothetical protein
VDAVGADQDVDVDTRAVRKGEAQRVAAVIKADCLVSQLDAVGGDLGRDRRKQVCSVRGVGLLAVQRLTRDGKVLSRQHGAVLPAPELPSDLELHGPLAKLVEDPELAQLPRGVRSHDEPGSNLAELVGLLVHGGGKP